MALRDWIWPRVTSTPEQEDIKRGEFAAAETLARQIAAIDDSNVDAFYDSCLRVYSAEEERRKTVETRATALLGGLAILSALVVTFGPNVIRPFWMAPSRTGAVVSVLYLIAAAYFSRAIWRTLGAFEVEEVHMR